MKSVTFVLSMVGALLVAAPALADQTPAAAKEVMTCIVPNEGGASSVSMNVSVQADVSADFIVVGLNEKGTVSRMFMQSEAGSITQAIQAGQLITMLLSEDFSSDSGVLRNAGVIALSRDDADANTFKGFLSANSSIYFLTCTMK